MFTTANHSYLYLSVGLYTLALFLYLLKIKTGFLAFQAGFIIYTLYIIGRGWLGGCFIPNPIFEGPFLLPWCIVLIALIMKVKDKNDQWIVTIIPILFFSIFAIFYEKGMIPPTPKKISLWTLGFFFSESMAHALFYCGASYAVSTLIKNSNSNNYHYFIVCGFIIFSVSQIVGAIWCYVGWGNTFRWGMRHMITSGIWLLYAAYLHLRFLPKWDMYRRAWYTIIAAAIVLLLTLPFYLHEMTFPRIGG
ncbi:MAG: cytochrome c biogenesis protein CcsA [Spirochaetota bacterium]|nr:cytochrome c biogenesis protein CcsA [Spirochaetota bacterium]